MRMRNDVPNRANAEFCSGPPPPPRQSRTANIRYGEIVQCTRNGAGNGNIASPFNMGKCILTADMVTVATATAGVTCGSTHINNETEVANDDERSDDGNTY